MAPALLATAAARTLGLAARIKLSTQGVGCIVHNVELAVAITSLPIKSVDAHAEVRCGCQPVFWQL